jgi:hypothetical protein
MMSPDFSPEDNFAASVGITANYQTTRQNEHAGFSARIPQVSRPPISALASPAIAEAAPPRRRRHCGKYLEGRFFVLQLMEFD